MQQNKHRQSRIEGVFLFACGAALFALIGSLWRPSPELSMIDFDAVYYASQAALHRADPYNADDLGRAYAAGDAHANIVLHARNDLAQAVTLCVNLPSTLLLMAPLAMLPWKIAHRLWIAGTAFGVIFAAFLMWKESARWAPRFAGLMAGFLLFGVEIVVETGNAAGVAVSLCVIAVWCFMRERHPWASVVCMALSLALKPQDAVLIWLLFVLAGGTFRKRAWQSAALCCVLVLMAGIWISYLSPHWLAELHANLMRTLSPGQGNDPAAKGVEPGLHSAMIISMQTVAALFISNPSLYEAVSYALCAPLLIAWGVGVLRCKQRTHCLWIAIAAIAPLTLLPSYHRQHDLLILLMAMPATAFLWSRGRRLDRFTAGFTALAILLTGSLALQLEGLATYSMRAAASGFRKTWLTLVFARPAPVLLFVLAALWLGVFVAARKRTEIVPQSGANSDFERTVPGN